MFSETGDNSFWHSHCVRGSVWKRELTQNRFLCG